MKKSVVLSLLLGVFFFLHAQFNEPVFRLPSYQLGGIFNPEIMTMNHSMSFMSGTSSTGYGFYQSAYTNHLRFDLRDNLKFSIDTSLVNFGSMHHQDNIKFSSNKDNQNVIVPAFSLEYKPTDNTTIQIQYQQIRGYQNNFLSHDQDQIWWR